MILKPQVAEKPAP